MDINCTNSCFYQHDGKCTLRDVPTAVQAVDSGVDCAYYTKGAWGQTTSS